MTSSSQNLTIVKMETPTTTTSTRGRKRTASQSSQGSNSYHRSSSVSSSTTSNYQPKKKLKKYELDPSKDVTVRNALAAKKNREKKKAEEIAMKQENMTLKFRLAQLEKELALYKTQEKKLLEKYDEEENTHILITPFGGSATVKDALEAIMPHLNEKYGNVTINQTAPTSTPTTTSSSSISNFCNTTTAASNVVTVINNNDNNHQVYNTNNIVNSNNNNNNVVQTYICLNDPLQWDASKYIDDFHLEDDIIGFSDDDDNSKYPLPGDLESSFNFNDLANFNDPQQQSETAEFLLPSQTDYSDKKPLVTNSDPFFGLHISADKKNVIIDHKPNMMW